MQQQTELRKHMQSLLRRNGLHYKARTRKKPMGPGTTMAGWSAASKPRQVVFRVKKLGAELSLESDFDIENGSDGLIDRFQ